jgi:hypothetical protein
MSSDIRLSTDFRDHPKVVKLHKLLGEAGISSLVTLWAWTRKYRSKGTFAGMDALDIEIGARWPGENGLFVKALVDLVLLDFDGEVYSIHDWKDWQPWAYFADERSAQSRKAAERRWEARRKAKEVECGAHEKTVHTASTIDAHRNADSRKTDAPSPPPSPPPLPKNIKKDPAADAADPPLTDRENKGNGLEPPSPKLKVRRRKEYSPEVLRVYGYYCEVIANVPAKKADALRNIAARLKEGFSEHQLGQAIAQYATECAEKQTPEDRRYHSNNFFGLKGYFTGFLPETVDEQEEEAQADV